MLFQERWVAKRESNNHILRANKARAHLLFRCDFFERLLTGVDRCADKNVKCYIFVNFTGDI